MHWHNLKRKLWTLLLQAHSRTAIIITTMSSSCQALLDALKDCVLHSDCVLKQGHLPSTCLKEHMDELPEQCRSLRKATYDCKRGMLDMRKRFRGNSVNFPTPPKDNSATTQHPSS